MDVRAHSGPSDTRAMQQLQSRIWPLGLHPGGVGWLMATGQFGDGLLVADPAGAVESDGTLSGWGALVGSELTVQVSPGADHSAGAILDRLRGSAGSGARLTLAITDDDHTLREAALQHGFVGGGAVMQGMWLDAGSVAPAMEAGYTLRPVLPEEWEARVESHRAAWRPADLPWNPDHRPDTPADATSSFTEEAYARCRNTWLYDSELDLVAVAADGAIAATCIAWLDPNTGVAELEPMGVDPAHRRRGLAVALCREVAHRVAALGGREVFINTGPNEAYPAPPAAYAKAGFLARRRGETWSRSL